MKTCSACKKSKPLTEFTKWNRAKDGLSYQCKECRYTSNAKWRASNKEKISELNKAYIKDPIKEQARRYVYNAIRDGKLARPDRCSNCGCSCEPHGHHDDYSKPLDVRWLCVPCHAAVHTQQSMGGY